jgi:hypothetical protein
VVVDAQRDAGKIYDDELITFIDLYVSRKGYKAQRIRSDFRYTHQFCHDLDGCDVVVIDENRVLTSEWISSFLLGRFIPCIRTSHLAENDQDTSVAVPFPIARYYYVEELKGQIEPIICWRSKEELVLAIMKHIEKLDRRRHVLKDVDDGDRYFARLTRKDVKVFISNPDGLNPLAKRLCEKLEKEYINFFQYKQDDAIAMGAKWEEVLTEEIKKCGVFVALVDKDYFGKEWCCYELDLALEAHQTRGLLILHYALGMPIPTKLSHIQGKELSTSSADATMEVILTDLHHHMNLP